MTSSHPSAVPAWARGDLLGLDFPVHLDALRGGGPSFLTAAFRAAGSIGQGNSVVAVTELEPFHGGSTGRKAVLTVAYEHPDPSLPEQLFAKFSRDLDNERRDRGKRQMESEVRFGLLSQIPDFPVAVPRCMFGEYEVESGSGLLITERIAFDENGIEPIHAKARDHEVEDLHAHYDALVASLARLAGSHRAGVFPEAVMAHFVARRSKPKADHRAATTPDQIRRLVDRYADFAARYPQLLPASIRSESFLGHLHGQAPRAVENAEALRSAWRDGSEGLTAFCHWNANIDNAWFWRNDDGGLACGLMDWGNVGQINMVTAISSCLTFAEPDFVIENLDRLLALFAAEFAQAGGGPLDPATLKLQYALHVVAGGLQWPLGAVRLIEHHIPDLATVTDRFDPLISNDEFARTQLHLLTASLMVWQASDPGGLIDWALRRAQGDPGAYRAPASTGASMWTGSA